MGDRLSRRLLVLRAVTLGGTGTALSACVPPPAYYPQPVVRGTGITDADPNDGPGNGRGGGYRRGTGITDADPNDGPGNGRGGGYRRGTGITDADPNDGPGNGRGGGYRSGRSDADPYDAPGRGRY